MREYEQKYGVDYEETFSPVISALKSAFAIAAIKNYVIMTFDIKTAFLYGILDEDVYRWIELQEQSIQTKESTL